MGRKRSIAAALLLVIGSSACATQGMNPSGSVPIYENPGEIGRVSGIGIESNDVVGMTDAMMRDMLANPTLADASTPPRVIVDAGYFSNESSSRINKNMIIDRLRNELVRSARGRMRFLSRESAQMIDLERDLKRKGKLDGGAHGMTRRVAGADYRLNGRIASLDSMRVSNAMTSRYHHIVFEMVDLETSEIVWSGSYEFKKSAQDDIVYR